MRTPIQVLSDILAKLPRTRHNRYSHAEDVFLVDKQGKVREHRQALTVHSPGEVMKRQRRMRIIQP